MPSTGVLISAAKDAGEAVPVCSTTGVERPSDICTKEDTGMSPPKAVSPYASMYLVITGGGWPTLLDLRTAKDTGVVRKSPRNALWFAGSRTMRQSQEHTPPWYYAHSQSKQATLPDKAEEVATYCRTLKKVGAKREETTVWRVKRERGIRRLAGKSWTCVVNATGLDRGQQ